MHRGGEGLIILVELLLELLAAERKTHCPSARVFYMELWYFTASLVSPNSLIFTPSEEDILTEDEQLRSINVSQPRSRHCSRVFVSAGRSSAANFHLSLKVLGNGMCSVETPGAHWWGFMLQTSLSDAHSTLRCWFHLTPVVLSATGKNIRSCT